MPSSPVEHIEGQLTLPGYVTVGKPTNEELIGEAEAEIAALAELAIRATIKPVE